MNTPLEQFLLDVMMPYLVKEQNRWDEAGEMRIVNEETGRVRGTEAFRMRQRLIAVIQGRADPGAPVFLAQRNDDLTLL